MINIIKDKKRDEYFAPSTINKQRIARIQPKNKQYFPRGSIVRVYPKASSSIKIIFSSGKKRVFNKGGVYALIGLTCYKREGLNPRKIAKYVTIPKFLEGVFNVGDRVRLYPFVPITSEVAKSQRNKNFFDLFTGLIKRDK